MNRLANFSPSSSSSSSSSFVYFFHEVYIRYSLWCHSSSKVYSGLQDRKKSRPCWKQEDVDFKTWSRCVWLRPFEHDPRGASSYCFEGPLYEILHYSIQSDPEDKWESFGTVHQTDFRAANRWLLRISRDVWVFPDRTGASCGGKLTVFMFSLTIHYFLSLEGEGEGWAAECLKPWPCLGQENPKIRILFRTNDKMNAVLF